MEWHTNFPDRPLTSTDLQALKEEYGEVREARALVTNDEGEATAVFLHVDDWAEAYVYRPVWAPELSDWETVWSDYDVLRAEAPEEEAREAVRGMAPNR